MEVKRKFQLFSLVILGLFVLAFTGCKKNVDCSGYLYVYFVGNELGDEQIHYALSEDGYNFRALNIDKPVIESKTYSSSGGIRDPHILRCQDGKTFYMVGTDLCVANMGWENQALVMMKSTDLMHWKSTGVNIPDLFPKEFGFVNRVWSPQTIYDKAKGKYMVYFSMRKNQEPDVLYYAYAKDDFTGLETTPKQLFYSPGNKACIDPDIVEKDGKFHVFFRMEDGTPGIKIATSDFINKDYSMKTSGRVDLETNYVEGNFVFKLNHTDDYILMYDAYRKKKYEFAKTRDFKSFYPVDKSVSMNFHPRQGCILPITKEEMKRLILLYGSTDDPLLEATSPDIKILNLSIDNANRTIHIPVKPGVDLSSFDPAFHCWDGFSIKPSGVQDFTKGLIDYTISLDGKGSKTYKVEASEDHNPIIKGYYGDPEIMYSHKTGKYYIYPTTDGLWEWTSTQFKVFSSDDLENWKDEGVIMDLKKEITWANSNAWSPSIVEKKIKGDYKYFFYYTAGKKIGVGVADNPTGPFKDKGEPLISELPKGITEGQQIDPVVFTDPKTKKDYLFWGNAYMAGAELNKNMISIKENTIKVLTPDLSFRGGTEVFYRKGKYYYLWSENDTRSPDYRVRYATSDSPMGKLIVPENNLILEKDVDKGIFGTGNCSVIQIPETDNWYIVYHRFTVPRGIKMGSAAGYYREVCMDSLTFDGDGNINKVKPTLKGVDRSID